jgi:hypothetical protein
MKRLSEYRQQDLQLVQPSSIKRDCELQSSDEILLKASFPKWTSGNAIVEGFGAKWIIRKPSVWKSEIEVCKDGFNYPIATYKSKMFRPEGSIELERGLRLRCEYKLLKGVYTIFSETNEEIIVIKQTGVFKKKITMILGGRRTETIDEYPWLPMLIWYIMIQNKTQSIASANYS